MIGFLKLTRSEGQITQREELVNVEAIDYVADVDGRAVIRFRHGGSGYYAETVSEIVELLRRIDGGSAECPLDRTCERNPGHEGPCGRAWRRVT